MKRDPASPYLSEAFHDVPDHAREFVARVSANTWALPPWTSAGPGTERCRGAPSCLKREGQRRVRLLRRRTTQVMSG